MKPVTHSPRSAFTLIELILVMALLVVVMALISPTLGGFIRGRSLDSEVRRFVALTHYAQARAANEGLPMRLWVDPEQRRYGLRSEYVLSQAGTDPREQEHELAPDLEVEVDSRSWATLTGNRLALQDGWAGGLPTGTAGGNRSQWVLRFTPDGAIDETSPLGVWIRHKPPGAARGRRSGNVDPRDEVYVGQNLMRLRYEVQTNQITGVFR